MSINSATDVGLELLSSVNLYYMRQGTLLCRASCQSERRSEVVIVVISFKFVNNNVDKVSKITRVHVTYRLNITLTTAIHCSLATVLTQLHNSSAKQTKHTTVHTYWLHVQNIKYYSTSSNCTCNSNCTARYQTSYKFLRTPTWSLYTECAQVK